MADDNTLEITLPGGEDESETTEDSDEVEQDQETEESEESEESEDEEESEDDKSEEDDKSKDEKKEDDETEEEDEEKPKGKQHQRTSFRDIKGKYPDFFKTFPDLRDAFFREREYTKIFPTIEDAKEVAAIANSFADISDNLLNGNPAKLLQDLQGANEQAFDEVAEKFLPTVFQLNEKTFYRVVNPLIEKFVQGMATAATKAGDENMRRAALYVGKYMTGEFKIPDTPRDKNPDARKLDDEKRNFYTERAREGENAIKSELVESLMSEINESLGEDEDLTDFMRQSVGQEILKKANDAVAQDPQHMALMQSLWRRWAKNGMTSGDKKKIVDAYLSRIRKVLPSTTEKVMMNALKKKIGKKKVVKETSQQDDNQSVGGKKNTRVISAKDVDWRNTSDKDFLDDRVKLRK